MRREVDDVLDEVFHKAGTGIRSLVVTGGEPLLHLKPLLGMLPRVLEHGFSVEIETNGTVRPGGLPHGVHLNVSPKLGNSMQEREIRVRPEVIKECLEFPSSVLKFVVGADRDIEEVVEIVGETGVGPERVYLMPLGTVRRVAVSYGLVEAKWLQLVSNKRSVVLGSCSFYRTRKLFGNGVGGLPGSRSSTGLIIRTGCTSSCGATSGASNHYTCLSSVPKKLDSTHSTACCK